MKKATFQFSAGCLVRKRTIFYLSTLAEARSLEFSVAEDKGLFSSAYTVTVSGNANEINHYILDIRNYLGI